MIYILYGDKIAIDLFDQSLEKLTQSSCYDFNVLDFSKPNIALEVVDGLFDFDGFRIITEEEYQELHKNLCLKIKKNVVDSNINRWKNLEKQRAARWGEKK